MFVSSLDYFPQLAEEVVWRLALAMAQLCSSMCRRKVMQVSQALHKSCNQAQHNPNPAHMKQQSAQDTWCELMQMHYGCSLLS